MIVLDRPNIVLQLLLHKNIEFLHVSSKIVFTHVDDEWLLNRPRIFTKSQFLEIAWVDGQPII